MSKLETCKRATQIIVLEKWLTKTHYTLVTNQQLLLDISVYHTRYCKRRLFCQFVMAAIVSSWLSI